MAGLPACAVLATEGPGNQCRPSSLEAWSSGRITGPTCWSRVAEGRWPMDEGLASRFRAVCAHFGLEAGRRLVPDDYLRSPRGTGKGETGPRGALEGGGGGKETAGAGR